MKTYVGDGIYAEIDEINRLVLTTENGYETTNRIVFEPREWVTLETWLKRPVDWNQRTTPREEIKGWPQ